MRDIEHGATSRNSFRPWEIELLVDFQNCDLGMNRRRVLRRYEKAALRSIERGAHRPLTLSEYLARTRAGRPRASAA
jgi:hypothetical protein